MDLLSSYIKKINKCVHCMHHLNQYMTLNDWQVDIVDKISIIITTC